MKSKGKHCITCVHYTITRRDKWGIPYCNQLESKVSVAFSCKQWEMYQ